MKLDDSCVVLVMVGRLVVRISKPSSPTAWLDSFTLQLLSDQTQSSLSIRKTANSNSSPSRSVRLSVSMLISVCLCVDLCLSICRSFSVFV